MRHCTCIICRKTMRNLDTSGNQPEGGTEFTTHGHYGSAVTDHMDGTGYAINICDSCLVDAGKAGLVLRMIPPKPVRAPKTKYKPWNNRD